MRKKVGEEIDFTPFERMMGKWLERNKLIKESSIGRGRRDEYIHGRSVEEIILELDKIANGLVFLVEAYQGWRNHPTRRKNEGLKTSLRSMRESIISASNMLFYIDTESTNDNGQYSLENQRKAIETFKSGGVESLKKLYQENDWIYTNSVSKVMSGLRRRRIVRDEPNYVRVLKLKKNK